MSKRDHYSTRTKAKLIDEIETLQKEIIGLKEKNKEQEQLIKRLKESEERFRLLYKLSPICYHSLDNEGRFTAISSAELDLLGYKREEVIGRWFGDFLAPGFVKDFRKSFLRAMAGREINGVQYTMVRGDGSYVDVEVNGRIVYDGEFRHVCCTVHNITELRKTADALDIERHRLQSIFRAVPVGIGVVNNRVIQFVNERFCKMTGYSAEELIGQNARMVYPSDEEYELVGKNKYEQIRQEGTGTVETRLQRKDGTVINVLLSSTPVDLNDLSLGVTFTVLDITNRKKSEEEVKHLNHVLTAIRNVNQLITHEKDRGILIQKACALLTETEGYNTAWIALLDEKKNLVAAAQSGLGKSFKLFIEDFKKGVVNACCKRALEQPGIVLIEGKKAECSGCPLLESEAGKRALTVRLEHEGSIYGFFSVSVPEPFAEIKAGQEFFSEVADDIAFALYSIGAELEHKRAEDALRESEERLKILFEFAPDAYYLSDTKGIFIDGNNAAEDLVGYDKGELIGKSFLRLNLLMPGQIPKAAKLLARNKLGKATGPDEFILNRKDGSHVPVEIRTFPVKIKGKTLVLGIVRNITERKRADEDIKRAIEAAQAAEQTAKAGSWRWEIGSNRVFWSDNMCRINGVTPGEFEGTYEAAMSTVHPDDIEYVRKKLQEIIREKKPDRIEYRIITPDGVEKTMVDTNKLVFDSRGSLKEILGMTQDITEWKQVEEEKARLEAQLRRSQKLENIGTLAGGIAHDFNNILTPILGYADMILYDLPSDSPIRDDIQLVIRSANRAKDLVQQILTFSRQIEQERKPLKLDLIVKEALKLLRPTLPATIKIRQHIDSNCGKVFADPSQMHQVLMNLCINAFHAMEERGGVITIKLKQVKVDPSADPIYHNLKENKYIRLTVSDTGIGMDEAALDRIFEPFFTTKGVGKGTGLGLSMVHGIVRSHDGDIVVVSEKGKGSTFDVYLPVMVREMTVANQKAQSTQGGNECILLVDDEVVIANLLKRILEGYGYQVFEKTCSIETLNTFRQQPDRYDLVITDLTMPNMTGLDLAGEIHVIRPDLPIILMTGYSEKITEELESRYGIRAVVMKPIGARILEQTIRKMLDHI